MDTMLMLVKIFGQLPPAGCVAVAMAHVMKYHQYPSSYNWAAMPNRYATSATAQLIKDIGKKVDMKYGLDGSGTDPEKKVPPAFRGFGYSGSVRYFDYASVTGKQKQPLHIGINLYQKA